MKARDWPRLHSRLRLQFPSRLQFQLQPQFQSGSWPRPRSQERERGSATIWAIGVMAVILVVAGAIALAGMTRAARHRARSAADLSALAAAGLALADPERGCAEASSLAAGNRARLVRCSVDGRGVAAVQVVIRLSLPVLGGHDVGADARAGPVHIVSAADPAEGSGRWPDPLARSHHGDSGVGLWPP